MQHQLKGICGPEQMARLTATLRAGLRIGPMNAIERPTSNTEAENSEEQIERYVQCIYESDDIVEIRRLPSGESTWHKASEIPAQALRLQRQNELTLQNIYAGANPRTAEGRK